MDFLFWKVKNKNIDVILKHNIYVFYYFEVVFIKNEVFLFKNYLDFIWS